MFGFYFGALTAATVSNAFISIWILDTLKEILKELRKKK